MSPFRCPSLFSILAYLEYDSGVFHPIGGCGAVSENMASVASRLGAQIRLGEPVEAIDFDGRRPTAVRTSQGIYPADAVVINADFARAMRHLGARPFTPALDRRFDQAEALLLFHIYALSGHRGPL
jgi:phytoene desaturase